MLERDLRPRGPYRLPPAGRDGIVRRRGGALARLLHWKGDPVIVHAWPRTGAVRVRSVGSSREAAQHGLDRMRFALCLDHDLAPFHARFRRDRQIGPVIRRFPWIRPRRRAEPFEALAWAITEQLIDTGRAQAIQRRLVWRYGRSSPCQGFRDAPSPSSLAGRAPAELQSCDLSAGRSLALVSAAREVASGRVDLGEEEPAWRRLRSIRGIGAWTLECLALHGQGRDDQLPAGDLAYLKLVGRLAGLRRRATEEEVRAYFAPYAPFTGLAGLYLLAAERHGQAPAPRVGARAPVPAAARW